MDTRDCNSCHVTPPQRAMYKGLPPDFNPPGANWETLDKLRKLTKMKLLIKGLDSGEDARLAVEHGVDGIVVSNHGGRALETGRGTIEALGEVVDAVGRQVPVFIDGGFRRGTDIYKALAIGAKGVGIGRPYIWGLTSFGQAGVEKVLEILRAELARTMRQCGTTTIAQITRDRIIRTGA
jgi:isopentenyl diphosphate isomerase/L-lactate dehydrogenase-like FMN-dependent dehydrogenase